MKIGARIETPRLALRHWTGDEADRAAFHRLNSDERVMRFFPYRLTRELSDARLDAVMDKARADGFGWGTACLRTTGEPVAFLGLARTSLAMKFGDAVEIGWRFLPEAWGIGLATEAGKALLDHGFSDLGLVGVIAVAAEANHASRRVMERIGMTHDPARDFDHPHVLREHPELMRHVFYHVEAGIKNP